MKKQLSIAMCMILLTVSGCSRSVDHFIKDLDNKSSKVRLLAASYLSYNDKDPETIKKIIGLLDSDNERLVFISAQILGQRADSSAVEPLVKLMSHKNKDIRTRAVISLGMINTERATEYVMRALEDSSMAVRKTAVKMIGLMKYSGGIEETVKFLNDPSADIRAEAVNTLYTFRDNPEAGIRAGYFDKLIRDKNELVRYVTVQALDHPYPDKATAARLLMTAFEDESKNVRAEAAKSIGKIKCADAIPRFKQVYGDEQYVVQVAITEAIKNITGEDFPDFERILKKLEKTSSPPENN